MEIKLSNSCSLYGQFLTLIILIPMMLFLWYQLIILGANIQSLIFGLVFSIVCILIIRFSYLFADVIIVKDYFKIKKLFYVKKIRISQLVKIERSIFCYVLVFDDLKKVYVAYGPDELIRLFFSSNPNKFIDDIKLIIDKNK
jgi:hypothetical protein